MIIPCPRCAAGLTGGASSCPSCRLPLTGPVAAALWAVDQRLGELDRQLRSVQGQRQLASAEHVRLLAILGQQAPAQLPTFAASIPGIPAPPRPPAPPLSAPRPRQEWTPRRVQNLLLTLGAVLLVIAGAVFTAVSWRHLGAAVRGSILVVLTGAAALGSRTLARRALTATAEAVAGVCLGLAAFDAYAFHALALRDVSGGSYWTVATGVLALGTAALAFATKARGPAIAAAFLALGPLLVQCATVDEAARAVFLSADALLAVCGLIALRRTGRTLPDVRACWQASASLLGVAALALSGVHIVYGPDGQPLGLLLTAVALCGVAAALAARFEAEDVTSRTSLSGAAALCGWVALGLPLEARLATGWWAVALLGCALAVALVALVLPHPWGRGPALTAAVTSALAAGTAVPSVLGTLGGELGWAGRPWTATGTALGRQADAMLVSPSHWAGPANLVALLVAAVVGLVVGEALGQRRNAALLATALGGLDLLVSVGQLGGSFVTGLVVILALAATSAAGAVLLLRRGDELAARAGTALALAGATTAVAWSLALPSTTAWVAAVAVTLLLGAALGGVPYRPVVVACSVIAAGYAVAGGARVAGTSPTVGGLAIVGLPLVLTVGLAVHSRWFGGRPSAESDAAGAAGLLVCAGALVVSATDPVWEGRVLLVAAVAVLVSCLRPERRRGLALGVAAVAVALTQLPFSQQLPASAEVGTCLGLCGLSLGIGWLLASSGRRTPEWQQTLAVLAGGSLVQAALAVGRSGSAGQPAGALVVIATLYAAVAALPDGWWSRAGLPLPVRGVAAGVAAASVLGAVAAAGSWAGQPLPATGVAVTGAAAMLAAAATGLRARQPDSLVVEVVAALAVVPALAACADRPAFAGWVLAITGASVLLAAGLRPDRRAGWPVGALLCSAATWTWLWLAGVASPEPYTDPIALVALWAGLHRRRSDPAAPSLVAYGPGLSGLLLPSLLSALTQPGLERPLLLVALATGVVVLGAQHRLRAPLVIGSATLALTALRLLAPYEAMVPRWLELATAGALLLTLGATYEQRRRDLHLLRSRYDALS